jgi:hypothetical protein
LVVGGESKKKKGKKKVGKVGKNTAPIKHATCNGPALLYSVAVQMRA